MTTSWLPKEQCETNDITIFLLRLHALADGVDLHVSDLGDLAGNPLILLEPQQHNVGPSVLIAAGFHGDEPGGCWGLLRFLEDGLRDFVKSANISFLPLVNPTGFRKDRRTNDWNEDPNRGFCHSSSSQAQPSREGALLVDHLSRLKPLAADGFLSLHEDLEFDRFYIYTFGTNSDPGPFSEALRSEESKVFEAYPDGPLEGSVVRNGIIHNFHDGSFEDRLFHEGVKNTACTETPGPSDISIRVEVNARLSYAFVRYAVDSNSRP